MENNEVSVHPAVAFTITDNDGDTHTVCLEMRQVEELARRLAAILSALRDVRE